MHACCIHLTQPFLPMLVQVPQADLPGALVLLQEIGEYESVIRLAAQWLDLNRNTQVSERGRQNKPSYS